MLRERVRASWSVQSAGLPDDGLPCRSDPTRTPVTCPRPCRRRGQTPTDGVLGRGEVAVELDRLDPLDGDERSVADGPSQKAMSVWRYALGSVRAVGCGPFARADCPVRGGSNWSRRRSSDQAAGAAHCRRGMGENGLQWPARCAARRLVRSPRGVEGRMRPKSEFLWTTGMVLATRLGDGLSTHLVTPDLWREINPLAAGGWATLIAAAGVVLVVSTILNYCHLFRPVDDFPQTPGATPSRRSSSSRTSRSSAPTRSGSSSARCCQSWPWHSSIASSGRTSHATVPHLANGQRSRSGHSTAAARPWDDAARRGSIVPAGASAQGTRPWNRPGPSRPGRFSRPGGSSRRTSRNESARSTPTLVTKENR